MKQYFKASERLDKVREKSRKRSRRNRMLKRHLTLKRICAEIKLVSKKDELSTALSAKV